MGTWQTAPEGWVIPGIDLSLVEMAHVAVHYWLCYGDESIELGVGMFGFCGFGLIIWVTLHKPTFWAIYHKIKDNSTYYQHCYKFSCYDGWESAQ